MSLPATAPLGPALERYRLPLALAGVYAAIGAALRTLLWWQFGRPAGVGPASLPALLAVGAVDDLLECAYLLAPFVLYVLLLPDRWYRTRWNRTLVATGVLLGAFGFLYLAAVEYFFFEEFEARFNLVAVDYLMYPTEVAGDIWAEYPVVRVLALAAVLAFGIFRSLRGAIARGFERAAPRRGRLLLLGAHAALVVALALGFRTDLLARWQNPIANEIALNGPSSFFRALRTSEIDYHTYYASADPARNLERLATALAPGGGTFTRLAEGRLDRAFPSRPDGLGRLNVVLVASESFGAEFSRLYGADRDWTPNFDRLAQQSVWFAHTYASGTRTVRGLEALSTSFPPIPSVSILRRPNNENVATWGGVLRKLGYHTSFLYGGYGYFDNMNYFFEHNGYEVLDRNSLGREPRFENVWGVSDEDLFDLALEHFDRVHASGRPFFATVMTTSNHKPFTFRPGLPGIPVQGGGREAGVKYADFALGYFIDKARSHAWFDDTVFVVVADHGARAYGRQQIPLRTYEIPLLIYAPKHLAPRRVDGLTTQIDVAPTVMGLLGLQYTAPFFGRDVLHSPEDGRIALFSHNHDVAILRGDSLAVLGLRKAVTYWKYDAKSDTSTPGPPDPDLAALGIAYYQTGFELFRRHAYE